MSSAWFQLPVHNAAPPSLHGVRRAVPPLQRYYGALRLPAVHLAALRFLRLAIPSLRPSFVPAGRDAEPRIILELVSRFSSRQYRWRRQGLPSSRGTRLIIRHVLRPRCDQARLWVQVSLMPGAAPASDKDEGSPTRKFRGSITQRLISLSTLRSDGHPPPRKTRFRLLARLCRTGLVTRRVSMKGFTFYNDPPFPSFLAQLPPLPSVQI